MSWSFEKEKKLIKDGLCLRCEVKIQEPVNVSEFTLSNEKTLAMWNHYCRCCREVYKCIVCESRFLQDEETYWKDICSVCDQPVCIKCRDPDWDNDYDDDSTCINCSKKN